MIVAGSVSKKYDGKYILKNFNYKFDKGVYLIRGKSGKGKTTLLNILSLKDNSYEGNVVVDGSIFYLKDKDNLVSNLTVKEHFVLFEKVNSKKIYYVFDIKNILNKKVKKLSLGEQQLVNLTLALNSEDENLILDEPFSALSKDNLKKACDLIEKESRKRTIIISSHNEEYFNNYIKIDLHKVKEYKECIEVNKCSLKKNRELKFSYLLIYFKKIIFKKVFFVGSLLSTLISFIFFNNYLDSNFNDYLSYFRASEGIVISRKNKIESIDENLFYEVIKKIAVYVSDYNASYYNSSLYEYDLRIGGYYLDNGFVLSSIKYIEENLSDNEVVLGVNYRMFCSNNGMGYCDEYHVNTLLVNKKIDGFPFIIKRIFFSEDTVLLSNQRFVKLYNDNEYEEYYFDIKKADRQSVFEIINRDELLTNFDFILIGENEDNLRYKVEVKKYKYFKDINYKNYIVCLDKGYNCLDYLNHFNDLIKIDNFEDISKLDLKLVDKDLNDNEIVISSRLSKEINKHKGDNVILFFKYNDEIKSVSFQIVDILEENEYYLYQNSEWSFTLFKELLNYGESDLRIKNVLIYEDKKEGDYESDDLYKEMIKEFKGLLEQMKKSIFYISLFLSFISITILVLLEVFQNKFKREYYEYLKTLNVEISKKQ